MTAGEIEPRPALPGQSIEAETEGPQRSEDLEAELAMLHHKIDRADAEASRLRAARLRVWVEARRAGWSWRRIAAASGGMDHAQIAKTLKREQEGEG